MKPTLLARQRVISASERPPRSWPCTITSPLVARSRPAIRFERVVLPEPEGPIKAQVLALGDLRSRSTRTGDRGTRRGGTLCVTLRRTIERLSAHERLTFRFLKESGRHGSFGDPDRLRCP